MKGNASVWTIVAFLALAPCCCCVLPIGYLYRAEQAAAPLPNTRALKPLPVVSDLIQDFPGRVLIEAAGDAIVLEEAAEGIAQTRFKVATWNHGWKKLVGVRGSYAIASWDPDKHCDLSVNTQQGSSYKIHVPNMWLRDVALDSKSNLLLALQGADANPSVVQVWKDRKHQQTVPIGGFLQSMLVSGSEAFVFTGHGAILLLKREGDRYTDPELKEDFYVFGARAVASEGGVATALRGGELYLTTDKKQLIGTAQSSEPSRLQANGPFVAAHFVGVPFSVAGGELLVFNAKEGKLRRWRPPTELSSVAVSKTGIVVAITRRGNVYVLRASDDNLAVTDSFYAGNESVAVGGESGCLLVNPKGYAFIK